MFFLVNVQGCVSFSIAAFSAGRPKASQPMGFKTCSPRMIFTRVITSPMM